MDQLPGAEIREATGFPYYTAEIQMILRLYLKLRWMFRLDPFT